MNPLNLEEVKEYVEENIVGFHNQKLQALKERKLYHLLKAKNPYLFKAKNLNLPQDLVTNLLDASLSSSEEEIFGNFLEDLALFVAKRTTNAWKSSSSGVDIEFENSGVHYLVSVKSGPSWGNNSQQKDQHSAFEKAKKTLLQSGHVSHVQPVLGICYGKTATNLNVRGAMKVVGQNFWYLLSESEDLYTRIIEPLGVEARKHNVEFDTEKQRIVGKFTDDFSTEFAIDGMVNWPKLVAFTCGNLDIVIRDGHPIPRKDGNPNRKRPRR